MSDEEQAEEEREEFIRLYLEDLRQELPSDTHALFVDAALLRARNWLEGFYDAAVRIAPDELRRGMAELGARRPT